MAEKFNFAHEFSIRGMKMLDIGVMFVIGSFVGIIFGKMFSKLVRFDSKDVVGNAKKYPNTITGRLKIVGEIMLEIIMYGIVLYIIRQFVQAVPWPFDGWKGLNPPLGFQGYSHKRNSESKNPWSLSFFFFIYQNSLKNKIGYFFNMVKDTPLAFLRDEENFSDVSTKKKYDDVYNNANMASM